MAGVEEAPVSEDPAVCMWREVRFLELGFPPLRARKLADRGADWHAAKLLLERGCSLEHAYRLLR